MNNKGFYNDNKEWTEKLKNFFKESGFYIMIVVGLCILAIGAVYFTTNHLISNPGEYEEGLVPDGTNVEIDEAKEIVIRDDTPPAEQAAVNEGESSLREVGLPEEKAQAGNTEPKIIADNTENATSITEAKQDNVKPTVAPTIAPAVTKAPAKPSQKADAEEASQEVIKLFEKTPVFIMPVEGKIIKDFAMDRLLYSKTLDEWRTHSGIDIAAPRGEPVRAIADGVILEIKNDPMYGITITIDHENGYKSIYSNLASDSMVSVNQKVKAGDAISSVGNTAIFECLDPPHLHFEIVKNDKLIDPKTVLPIPKE